MSAILKNGNEPEILEKDIPGVRTLIEKLGFQYATTQQTKIFSSASLTWRKSYMNDTTLPKKNLNKWAMPDVRNELGVMADYFLVRDGGGERFWSAERDWIKDKNTDLIYPKDKDK